MYNLEVMEFIKNNVNWKERLTSDPFNLIINEDNDYYLLRYNQLESDFTNNIVKECRGLIIDKQTLTPKALSFTKFFNIQEPNADRINWKSARVQEKVDGSKILVWYDNNKWHVSTSGTLNAFEANVSDLGYTFGDLFIEALENANLYFNEDDGIYSIEETDDPEIKYYLNRLQSSYCYTFELVSPKSRIVVPYKKTELYFIGLRDMRTLEELHTSSSSVSKYLKCPKSFNLNSIEACMKAVEKMGFDEEGFVVVDQYWRRVKIKSPAYVAAHYLRNNGVQSLGKLLELVEMNEADEFLSYYPEWTDKVNEIKLKMSETKQDIRLGISNLNLVLEDPNITRKDMAKYIMTHFENISGFLFKYIDTDLTKLFIDTEWNKLSSDQKLERMGLK